MVFREFAQAAKDGFLGSIYLFISVVGAFATAIRDFVNHQDEISKRHKLGS